MAERRKISEQARNPSVDYLEAKRKILSYLASVKGGLAELDSVAGKLQLSPLVVRKTIAVLEGSGHIKRDGNVIQWRLGEAAFVQASDFRRQNPQQHSVKSIRNIWFEREISRVQTEIEYARKRARISHHEANIDVKGVAYPHLFVLEYLPGRNTCDFPARVRDCLTGKEYSQVYLTSNQNIRLRLLTAQSSYSIEPSDYLLPGARALPPLSASRLFCEAGAGCESVERSQGNPKQINYTPALKSET